MKHKLMDWAPKQIEVQLPRKDVVKLLVYWQDFKAFSIHIGLAVTLIVLPIVLLFLFWREWTVFAVLARAFILGCCFVIAFLIGRQGWLKIKGYAEIMLTPREIQQQLYAGKKKWGEKNQVRWRNMEVFMPTASTDNEISITGATTPRGQLDKHLNWRQLQVLQEWMRHHYRSFYQHYNAEQIQYIERWMEVLYQHYKDNPEVDELEENYFWEAATALNIDLSQHLIDD